MVVVVVAAGVVVSTGVDVSAGVDVAASVVVVGQAGLALSWQGGVGQSDLRSASQHFLAVVKEISRPLGPQPLLALVVLPKRQQVSPSS